MMELGITEARAHLCDVLRQVEAGEEVVLTRGIKKEPVAVIVPIATDSTNTQ